MDNLRNIAVIAHVDHGKTTLVDAMLKQTKTFAQHQKENQQTTILDSNELEREKGVTILAKNTAVSWHDYKINILDTPGHADFSGEVERVLGMADGCILLVDAAEGVLSQTKFVLSLALELGLLPVVIVNKVDRKDQRVAEVINEIQDLFLDLATSEDQLDFPTLYARGIDGVVGKRVIEQEDHGLQISDSTDLTPLFETLIDKIPAPAGDVEKPLQIQVNSLDADNYLGRIIIGKISQGTVRAGQKVVLLTSDNQSRSNTVEHLFIQQGLERVEVAEASAGEIVALTGIKDPQIGDTVADPNNPQVLPPLVISEPTVKMKLVVNTSPFSGQDSKFNTARQLQARIAKELETNVGLKLEGSSGESITLVGRGELHLAILIETMRREGYEFAVSRPEVVIKTIDGVENEPWEEVLIEVPEDYVGVITAAMPARFAQLQNMIPIKGGVRFYYHISTANLIGFRNELLTSTSGEGVLNSRFLEFRPISNRADTSRGGAIIAQQLGKATSYALEKAQQRGTMLVDPGEDVYPGQVVGINFRQEEMIMNITKGKKLTNMRAASADATVVLAPAWKPSLEQFLTLIEADESLEVTPHFMRLRKTQLPKALRS